MLSQQKISNYLNEGFVIIKDFLGREEINNLRNEAKGVFALQIRRLLGIEVNIYNDIHFEKLMYKLFELDIDTFMNCGKQVQQLISLHKISTNPKIEEVLKNFGLKFPIISVRPSMLFNSRFLAKKEEYWRLGAHQDWRSSQGSLDSVTVWFPLINSNAAIGALQVIPGTHKLGLLESESVSYYGKIIEDFKNEDYQQLEFEIGDVLFFSSFLVHRSGINITESIRWSVQLRFNNITEETFINRGFPNPFIYKPQADLITPGFPVKEQVLNVFTSK
jgi:phytanoyl-CoA hydroxylase